MSVVRCFGGKVEEDADLPYLGGNIGWLTPKDREYNPISGIPRMGNVAVPIFPG